LGKGDRAFKRRAREGKNEIRLSVIPNYFPPGGQNGKQAQIKRRQLDVKVKEGVGVKGKTGIETTPIWPDGKNQG